MKLVDVHAHLEHPKFEGDLDEVVGRFEEGGGELIVTSGVNPETNRKALELAGKYDCVKASFGLYPIDALAREVENSSEFLRDIEEFDVDEELGWIEEHAEDCVAIGEVGLDYNWKEFQSDEMRDKQKGVFREVLRLAKKLDKTVIVHSRKAEGDAVDILEEFGVKKVVMHCFNGRKSLVRRGVENGWSFSVPPSVVRLDHFKMLVEMVPLGQLLTETDAPWLSPVVGERNEPANVLVTLKEIARIKEVGVEESSKQIFKNAEGLFG
jgi:TatD DNase family protein